MRDALPYALECADALAWLGTLPDGCADAVVTDPPYGLRFMGKDWDRGVPGVPYWQAVRRVLKPGSYLLAFGGTRTYHRQVCAIEDAGLTIRDTVMWLHGQGFPKGKACLKPAWEPITLAVNPAKKVKPLGIDACRIEIKTPRPWRELRPNGKPHNVLNFQIKGSRAVAPTLTGRWPANVVHDGSPEVLEAFAAFGKSKSRACVRGGRSPCPKSWGKTRHDAHLVRGHTDTGTAARFYYCAKPRKRERSEDNTHPTVKPTELMHWLVRLVTEPGDLVLDPFAGSGTTGVACLETGRRFAGCELSPDYHKIARARLRRAHASVVAA